MMSGAKPFYTSKSLIGAAVMLLAFIAEAAGWFGWFKASAEEQSAIVEHLTTIGASLGGLMALWGRLTAKKNITLMLMLLALCLAGSGCAGINGENKKTTTYPDGTVVEENITTEGKFYDEIGKMNKDKPPAWEIVAAKNPDGTYMPMTFTGVARISYYGDGGLKMMPQYKNQYLEAFKDHMGILGVVGNTIALGDANEKLVKAMHGMSGVNIRNLTQTATGGSGIGLGTGAGTTTGTGSQPTTTTTTTETTTTTTTESPEAP
jgi:hypothetical protein